jgi:hypothetical protein
MRGEVYREVCPIPFGLAARSYSAYPNHLPPGSKAYRMTLRSAIPEHTARIKTPPKQAHEGPKLVEFRRIPRETWGKNGATAECAAAPRT